MSSEEQLATGIVDPNDSDVLCGRGGAALRHPGNQTYRRLVNLNKGLYTTCMKTEKLKISRSIVAAIREQQGRFLEKDSKSGTWYDIGDKKAIEKTSQALREGQPKLRQKIVEMGGAPGIDQFGHPGLGFPDQLGLGGLDSSMMDPAALMMPPPPQLNHQVSSQRMPSQSSFQSELSSLTQPPPPPTHLNHQVSRSAVAAAAQTAAMREQEIRSMQPPLPDPVRQDMHAEMFQRLSLRNLNAAAEEDAHRQQQMQQHERIARSMRPSLTQRHTAPHELGMLESQLSLASEFSAFAGRSGESLMSLEAASFRRNVGAAGNNGSLYGGFAASNESGNNFFTQQQGGVGVNNGGSYSPRHAMNASSGGGGGQSAMGAAGTSSSAIPPRDKLAGLDRRHVFAKMKYTRPPSVRGPGGMNQKSFGPGQSGHNPTGMSQYSLGDGMPDIHMVESSMSLFSNVSNMTDGLSRLDLESTHDAANANDHHHKPLSSTSADRARAAAEHSRDINWGGGHTVAGSVMSGLSRIDDASIDNSIFSDLSKKMSNMSTRSVAMSMSEISVLDLQEGDNEDEDSGNPEFVAHGLEGFSAPMKHRRQEYDLS